MIERRKSHRVRLTIKNIQSHLDTIYRGQLQSISPNGALVRFEKGIILPTGRYYNLTVYLEEDDAPLCLIVEVVCTNYTVTGLKFVSSEADAVTLLSQLVDKFNSGPDKLRTGLEQFRKQMANYLQ